MSLTKEEIFKFTEDYLDVEYEYQETDDFVVKAWANFLESHRLNPLSAHEFVFTAPDALEPWDETEYDIIWRPQVVLGINTFDYENVYLGVCLRRTEGSANVRMRGFIPQLGYGFIK